MLECSAALACVLSLASCSHAGPKPAPKPAQSSAEQVEARRVMLLGESTEPAFFLGPEADAPAIAFGGAGAKLILRGPSEQGRTPVQVHGRVTLEAYVTDSLLELRAQRAMTLPGTLVSLEAGDTLRVLGTGEAPNQLKVGASVSVGESELGPFVGELPLAELAANTPQEGAPESPREPAIAYLLPAQTAMPLFDEPEGELKALLPPQAHPLPVAVLAVEANGFRVRVGRGPYLVAFTQVPLVLLGSAPGDASSQEGPALAGSELPHALQQTRGTLMRIASGTKLSSRGRVVATFRSDGYARVLATRGQEVEVLAAADDVVAVRGVTSAESLFPLETPMPEAADEDASLDVARQLAPARAP